jgi:hypothetical protein
VRSRWAGAFRTPNRSVFAEIRGVANSEGAIVRVSLQLLLSGRLVEQFSDLQVAPGMPDDLFDTINRQSRYVVAVDPGFATAVPQEGTFAFTDDEAVPVPEVVAAGTPRRLFSLTGSGPAGAAALRTSAS